MQHKFLYTLEYIKNSFKNANINVDYPCYKKCKPNGQRVSQYLFL